MRGFGALLGGLLALAARAQSFDLYGVGPRSVAMAGTMGSSEGDYAATFYNPALLKKGGAGGSFLWSKPFLGVEQVGVAGPSQALTAQVPVDYGGFAAGFAVPLAGLLKDKATLGVAFFVPLRHVFRSRMIDESTAYFLRYDNAPDRIQILVGASARPGRWLSLGLGVQLMSDYGGDARFAAVLGTANPGRVTRRNLTSEVTGVAAPLAGFELGPFKRFKLFAAWRAQVLAVYHLPIAVDLGMFGKLDVTVGGVSHFAPHTLSGGASYTLLEDRLFFTAELNWEQWSKVPPLVAVMAIELDGTLLDLGFNRDVVSRPIEMGFSDVANFRLALEWRHTPRLKLRAGYGLRPTPVPPQNDRTNFLDSTAHLLSAGAGYTLDDPLQMAQGLTLEGAAQVALTAGGQTDKPVNSSNPGYRFGGAVLTLSVGARYEF